MMKHLDSQCLVTDEWGCGIWILEMGTGRGDGYGFTEHPPSEFNQNFGDVRC